LVLLVEYIIDPGDVKLVRGKWIMKNVGSEVGPSEGGYAYRCQADDFSATAKMLLERT